MKREVMLKFLRDAYRNRCQQVYGDIGDAKLGAMVRDMPLQPWPSIEANFARMPWWMTYDERYRQAAQMSIVEPAILTRPNSTPEEQKLDEQRLAMYLAREAYIPGEDD